MTTNPIIPIFMMIVISIFLLVIVIINKKHLVTRILIIILLFIINLRPMELTSEVETFNTNLDILFVVDTTISMDAEDIKDTRLTRAANDIKYIMKELAERSKKQASSFDTVTPVNMTVKPAVDYNPYKSEEQNRK